MNLSLQPILDFLQGNIGSYQKHHYIKGELIPLHKGDEHIFFLIVKGSIRLVDKGRTFDSFTLSIISSLSIIGPSTALSRLDYLTLRADTDALIYSFNFNSLPSKLQSLLTQFRRTYLCPSEWALIQRLLLENSSTYCYSSLTKNHPSYSWPQDLSTALNELSYSKIVYLDYDSSGFTYGHVYPFLFVKNLFVIGSIPRCFPIPEEIPSLTSPSSSDKNLFSISNEPHSSLTTSTKSSTTASPEPSLAESQPFVSSDFSPSDFGYNFIQASDFSTAIQSCLLMLCQHLNLPTRKDVIKKFVESCSASVVPREKIPSLLSSFCDSQGLSVSTITAPKSLPIRLPVPSIGFTTDFTPFIVVGSNSNSIQVINPISGPLFLTKESALSYFNSELPLISVGIGIHTPQQRFSYAWFLPYISQYRIQILEVVSASFLTQIFALATPLLFQQLIDRVVSKGAADSLTPLLTLMLVFLLLEISFSTLRTFQFAGISNRIDIGIGSTIISRLLRINGRFFDRRPVGELAGRLQEIDSIRRFLTGTALTAVLDAFFASIYFIVMFLYSPILSLVVACSVPLLVLSTVGISPLTQRLCKRAEASSRTQSFLVELISGIQTVKLQNSELLAKREWQRHLKTIDIGFKAIIANTARSSFLQHK